MRTTKGIAALVVLAALAATLNADVVLNPIDDGYVSKVFLPAPGWEGVSNGFADLWVGAAKNGSDTLNRKIILEFDISSLGLQADSAVLSIENTWKHSSMRDLLIYSIQSADGAVTLADFDSSTYGVLGGVFVPGTEGTGTKTIDVTAAVNDAFDNSRSYVSFRIEMGIPPSWDMLRKFVAVESTVPADRPKLTIVEVPEPATAAVLLGGGLLLAIRKQRNH